MFPESRWPIYLRTVGFMFVGVCSTAYVISNIVGDGKVLAGVIFMMLSFGSAIVELFTKGGHAGSRLMDSDKPAELHEIRETFQRVITWIRSPGFNPPAPDKVSLRLQEMYASLFDRPINLVNQQHSNAMFQEIADNLESSMNMISIGNCNQKWKIPDWIKQQVPKP